MDNFEKFKREIAPILNRLALDARCEIPDFVLADHLGEYVRTLAALGKRVKRHKDGEISP